MAATQQEASSDRAREAALKRLERIMNDDTDPDVVIRAAGTILSATNEELRKEN